MRPTKIAFHMSVLKSLGILGFSRHQRKIIGGAALMHIKKVMRANVQTTTLLCKKYGAKEFTRRA